MEEGGGKEPPDAAMAEADDIISLSECVQNEFLCDQAVQEYFIHGAAEEFTPGSRNGNTRWEKYDRLSPVNFFVTIIFLLFRSGAGMQQFIYFPTFLFPNDACFL
jgi:hypothetical protein